MKRIELFFSIFLAAALVFHGASAADREAREPPRPRLLFIFAPNTEDKTLIAAYDKLQHATDELEANDVLTVFVIGDRTVKVPPDSHPAQAADLRRLYHVDADAFRIVLVGKDGWQKMRWSEPVDPGQILARAGEMPTGKKREEEK